MSQINARVRHKRDTSANWTSQNPVLLSGELIVVDTDSGEVRFKIGDGVKTYTQLPFQDEVVRGLISTSTSECKADAAAKLEEAKAYADEHLQEVAGDTITWDGNTEGLPTYQSQYYRIASAPAESEINSGKFTLSDGTEVEFTASDISASRTDMYIAKDSTEIFFYYNDDPEIEGTYVPSNLRSLTLDGYTGFTMKKLKEEYLPAHAHDDLYYSKDEIDNLELITIDDIDAICGGSI